MYKYEPKNNPHDHYIPAIPLRDLSKDEFEALTDLQQAAVKQSPLYTKARTAKKDGDK